MSELRAISGSEELNAVRWLPAPMVTRCDTLFAQHVTMARGAPVSASMLHAWHRLGFALAWLMGARQDIYPLHHAEILMRQHVAMRHKAAHRDRIEVGPKRDRPALTRIDIGRGVVRHGGLRDDRGDDDGIVPFRSHQGRAGDCR